MNKQNYNIVVGNNHWSIMYIKIIFLSKLANSNVGYYSFEKYNNQYNYSNINSNVNVGNLFFYHL